MQIDIDARDLRQFRAQFLDHLVGRQRPLVARLQGDEEIEPELLVARGPPAPTDDMTMATLGPRSGGRREVAGVNPTMRPLAGRMVRRVCRS